MQNCDSMLEVIILEHSLTQDLIVPSGGGSIFTDKAGAILLIRSQADPSADGAVFAKFDAVRKLTVSQRELQTQQLHILIQS